MPENRNRLEATKLFLKGSAYLAALIALSLAVFITFLYIMGFQIVPGPSYTKNQGGEHPRISSKE